MEEGRNAFRILTGTPAGQRPLGRPRRRWEETIRMDHNLLKAYDVISSHAIAVMQWPVCLNISCCSSGLTQNL
jgi:hypothetical protein